MNGFSKSLLVLSILFSVFIHINAVAHKPWTFLVYMAAANDLNQYALLNLQEMMKVGSTDHMNIIVYITSYDDDKFPVTKKLYITKNAMVQIGTTMVRDSGDIASLEEALQWACLDYPSDHIAVVLWSEGSGSLNRSHRLSRGVCYDTYSGHYLTDRDCVQAFSWACDTLRKGKKFDIIIFDACFLASLEMAYSLSSCADYMVASQASIADRGHQHASLLNQSVITAADPLAFVQQIVNMYSKKHANTKNYTLSAIDLNALDALVENSNAIAQILTTQLKGKNKGAVKNVIKKCINTNSCIAFDEGIYIDLCLFYKNLLKNINELKLSLSLINPFKTILNNSIGLFATIVKSKVSGVNYKQAGGLSIYFGRFAVDPSYYGLYWTEKNPNWLELIEAFLE